MNPNNRQPRPSTSNLSPGEILQAIAERREAISFAASAGLTTLGEAIREPEPKKDMFTKLKETLKARHLSRDERQMFHRPNSDYCQSPKGEIKKSATTLEVADLVQKFCK